MTNRIKVEKGIPIMSVKSKNNQYDRALQDCEVGDSFLIPTDENTRQYVYAAARRLGMRVSTRAAEEEQRRVWRIE